MKDLKEKLISQAQRRYSFIRPCATKQKLDECFTITNGKLIFWFNTSDNSTHVMSISLFSGVEQ